MGRYIVDLRHKLALQESVAGGKGANLARLRKLGFSVPPGFVITPEAFTKFLNSFLIEEIAQKHNWTQSELQLILNFFQQSEMPDELRRPIIRAYRKIGAPVAVRSSMLGEDADVASFAGQLDTYLNVASEAELIAAVKRCWVSLFSGRLFSYVTEREQTTLTSLLSRLSIAVVVQRMVPARAAGVAFSANPITGGKQTVIEAVAGLGDALVAGMVEPDRYVLDARGEPIEVQTAGEASRVLAEDDVSRLAQLIQHVHHKMQAPQDVEWAWDGENFYVLQSRPITSLIGKRVYSANMVSEMLPGLIKPLVWSVSTKSKLQHVLGRIFTELIGPNEIDFTLLAKRIHSRIYADNTMLGQLFESMGMPPNFFEVMSRDERVTHHQRMPINGRTLRTMLRIGRFLWRYANMVDEIETYIARHTQALDPYREANWSDQDARTLLKHIDTLHSFYDESMWYNFVGPINMMLRNQLLKHLIKLWSPDVVPSDLIRGLMGLKSLESNRALQELAVQARELDADTLAVIASEPAPVVREALMASEQGRVLVRAMDDFLARYGCLSTISTDISRTPWAENPTVIWQSIARMTQSEHPSDSEAVAALRLAAKAKARSQMRSWQKFMFERVMNSTVAYINLRERTSFLVSEDSFQMRRVFLALARQWVQSGYLVDEDDIFYLALDEIRQLAEGALAVQTAQERIVVRRQEMAADALLDLPDTICGDTFTACRIEPTGDQSYLTGIVASSGVVRGHACIVQDPIQAPSTLGSDDILVVPFTDVSWTPLFVGIGGVIAESGGQLSHSAIIAREYGLPAVVNVKNATRLIKPGQAILVDANQGRVYLE